MLDGQPLGEYPELDWVSMSGIRPVRLVDLARRCVVTNEMLEDRPPLDLMSHLFQCGRGSDR